MSERYGGSEDANLGFEPDEPQKDPQQLPAEELARISESVKRDEAGWQQQREQEELHKDRLAIDAITAYCVYGRPRLSDPVFERWRRRMGDLAPQVETTHHIPAEGPVRNRYLELIQEAHRVNQEIEAAAVPRTPTGRTRRGTTPGNVQAASRSYRR